MSLLRERFCEKCGKQFRSRRWKQQYCGLSCSSIARGDKFRALRSTFVPLTINGSTAVLHLTKGWHALIDYADWDSVSKYAWFASEPSLGKATYLRRRYAIRKLCGRIIGLHNDLMGTRSMVDHADGNGLNNRRTNLRLATGTQNQCSRRKARGGTSRFKGVSKRSDFRGWVAQIKMHRRTTYLGRFQNEEDAARAYDSAAVRLFGEFAHLNFPVLREVDKRFITTGAEQ